MACSRRAFIGWATTLAAGVACEGRRATEPSSSGIDVGEREIRVTLARVPELSRPGGAIVVWDAGAIIVHRAPNVFAAFSNVCSHAGCGISQIIGDRLRCQCHGSEFDFAGANVIGPATSPLSVLAVEHDRAAGILRVARRVT